MAPLRATPLRAREAAHLIAGRRLCSPCTHGLSAEPHREDTPVPR